MCITANKHVHALKSWNEVPNGWKFTDINMSAQTQQGSGISNCVLSKMLWFGLCNPYCTKWLHIPAKLHGHWTEVHGPG